MIMGGDSCTEGRGFESLTITKIKEKEAGNGPYKNYWIGHETSLRTV